MSRCALTPTDPLLILLRAAHGQPVSGDQLGVALGISRAAIWKRIQRLRTAGYVIDALKNRGYRLMAAPDTLERPAMIPLLGGSELFRVAHYVHEAVLDSTNNAAKVRARAGAPEGTCVATAHQTHGRGRLGRSWCAPPGVNLTFSIVLRPRLAPVRAAQLTLLAGVALAETMSRCGLGASTRLKWPNDLLLDGYKAAGILTEMSAEQDRVRYVIVGIGLNVNMVRTDFPPELRDLATSMRLVSGENHVLPEVLATFLLEFERCYRRFQREGFAAVRSAWSAWARIEGQRVRIHLHEGAYDGMALALDEEGFLMVRRADDGKMCRVIAGDVALT
jgi:BirA family biotin operon repressor/biotin-[acetyl-CoA-carboxylase] ligase